MKGISEFKFANFKHLHSIITIILLLFDIYMVYMYDNSVQLKVPNSGDI